ncbi:S-adenosyl-L-methionine-dependent methyltransferase [Sphaerisporangium siamense]|nr:S-adenosyl-L-methionine-dependent methyltransferase [Sphaerisporangium siamense]
MSLNVKNDEEVSRTALMAAAARAAHLVVDGRPPIFEDTLAYALLGEQADDLIGYHRAHGAHLVLRGARTAALTRSRYTEDRLAEAVGRGIGQYVILGAGLDSYAHRAGKDGPVRVFEVDHPATQRWKRRALDVAGVPDPGTVAFVPVDFERDDLAERLAGAGFDPAVPALVSWLGVTMYLTREAIGQTLAVLAGLAPGTEVVVEWMLPESLRDEEGRAYAEAVSQAAAQGGEPWLTFLGPDEATALLAEHGLEVAGHAFQRDAIDPALWERTDELRPQNLPLLTHARVPVRG